MIWQKQLPQGFYNISAEKPLNAITVKQIHTDQVVSINDARNNLLEADGLFWNWSDIKNDDNPTVLTADCLPVVILGKKGGAILHAGWRGVKAKIYLNPTIKNIDPYYFFIGPSIQQPSFEVTEEFLEYFAQKNFFQQSNGKITFDLQRQTIFDLKNAFPHIEGLDSKIDTYTDLRFQSFRRDKLKRTNNYNFFSLMKECL